MREILHPLQLHFLLVSLGYLEQQFKPTYHCNHSELLMPRKRKNMSPQVYDLQYI
jgi:hypothetical protein